jgi:hypothetical protein
MEWRVESGEWLVVSGWWLVASLGNKCGRLDEKTLKSRGEMKVFLVLKVVFLGV